MSKKTNKMIVTQDLKTGQWEKDDPLERHGYVFGTMVTFPGYPKYRFEYFFCASGNILQFDYEMPDEHTCIITCPQDETHKQTLTCKERHPLLDYLLTAYDYVKGLPCEPTPGEHCQSLYGEPCQFLSTTCPLNDLPAIVEAAPPPATVQAIMDLPAERRVGAAFLLVLSDDLPDEAITPELKSLAWQGIAQLRNGATRVMKRIKDATPEGDYILVGEDRYGWKPKAIVDVETALELMMSNGMDAADLAKRVSLSRSEIEKISVRQFPGLAELILDACVDESGAKEFGLIKEPVS